MSIPRNILEMMFPDAFREADEGTREILRSVYDKHGIDGVIEEAVRVSREYLAVSIEVEALRSALSQVKEAGSWDAAKDRAAERINGSPAPAPSLSLVPPPSDDVPGFYL